MYTLNIHMNTLIHQNCVLIYLDIKFYVIQNKNNDSYTYTFDYKNKRKILDLIIPLTANVTLNLQ